MDKETLITRTFCPQHLLDQIASLQAYLASILRFSASCRFLKLDPKKLILYLW